MKTARQLFGYLALMFLMSIAGKAGGVGAVMLVGVFGFALMLFIDLLTGKSK